jgi:hypothetical protein
MSKNELLKILGFKSCCICHNVFTEGEKLRVIDGPYEDGQLSDKIYHFCNKHKPTFGHNLAVGSFGRYYKDGLKVFCWISGHSGFHQHWSQIDSEKVEEWLDRIYKD